MNFLNLIKILLPLILQIIGQLKDERADDCPDGICEDIETSIAEINGEVNGPSTRNLFDFISCLDVPRFFAAVKELASVLKDAMTQCPPQS